MPAPWTPLYRHFQIQIEDRSGLRNGRRLGADLSRGVQGRQCARAIADVEKRVGQQQLRLRVIRGQGDKLAETHHSLLFLVQQRLDLPEKGDGVRV